MGWTFTVTDEQQAKIAVWLADVEKRGLESGVLKSELECLGFGEANVPYYGAIGGALEYLFYGTSLGDVCKVRHVVTKEELDVTDYDSW